MHKIAFGAAAPLLFAVTVFAQTAQTTTVPPLPKGGSSAKPGQPSTPVHPLTTAQAHELMQLTGTDQIKTKLIDNITASTQRSFPPFIPADVKEDVHNSLEKMDVETPTVAIYQRYLSTEDAQKTIEFYKTPAGKNFVAVMPSLMGEVQQSAMQQARQTFQAAVERHKSEIEAAQKTYEQQHPTPGTPSLGGPGMGGGSGSSAAPKASGGTAGTSSTPKKP